MEYLKKFAPDIIIVAAFGQILPKSILDLPKYGCINVHASLLPKYRGAAPIQWAVINGDEITGVTTMRMDVGLDTGDIIAKNRCALQKMRQVEVCLTSWRQSRRAVCGNHADAGKQNGDLYTAGQ